MSPNRADERSTRGSKSNDRRLTSGTWGKLRENGRRRERGPINALPSWRRRQHGGRSWIAGGFLLPSVVAIGRPHRTNYRLGSCSWVPLRVAWIGGEALLEHAAVSSVNRRTVPTTASTVDPSPFFYQQKWRKDIFFLIKEIDLLFERINCEIFED